MENKKVLVIDHEDWFIDKVLKMLLDNYGEHSFNYTKNFENGVSLLKEKKHEIVIIELNIPVKFSQSETSRSKENELILLLNEINSINSNVKIICYTTENREIIINQIIDLNARHVCKTNQNSYEILCNIIAEYMKS